MAEYTCGLSPRTVSVLSFCFLMGVAKALIIIHPICFIDLSAPKCSRKLECGSGVCVCVCDLSLTNLHSPSFERQGASIEQPFNVTVNLLLFLKKFPLKKSSNKLAKLEMRPQFVLALNFRELLNKQKSMNSNNHKVISMINQVLKLV